MNLDLRKKFLLDVLSKAGITVASRFNRISHQDIKSKSEHEIVTSTDLEVESYIIKSIRDTFPNDSILSEESGGEKETEDFLWIIDPLDGTTNFYMGNPVFTTSISLAFKSKIILGGTYHPLLKQMFFVEKGKGFSFNNQVKKVSQTSDLSEAFIAFCHGTDEFHIKKISDVFTKLKPRCKDIRQLGSASFELALVASGKIDAFIMPGVRAWDVAAGSLMVREATGCVVDFNGQEWDLTSRDLLATNDKLRDTILQILKQ